jgi:hypothetical protein
MSIAGIIQRLPRIVYADGVRLAWAPSWTAEKERTPSVK